MSSIATAIKGLNGIHKGDCIRRMDALPAGCIDLAFADPPFNIGYDYDVYDDRQEHEQYLAWSRQWIAAVYRVLKPTGTFWLAIGDEYAAELKLASQEIGFHTRSWVVWYYTFGVNCKYKFSRSHAHLFYFVKDPDHFTFSSEELENRIPSARQLVYADTRANPRGRLPDDTWVLRPQDLAECFTTGEDTWYLPRVAGTFKERAGFHGCQMPEQLLGRIVRLCSAEGEIVLDPFSGSATTVAVAKKLGRRYIAFDLSDEYVDRGRARLADIRLGDPLEGAPEPTLSAPATPKKKSKGGRGARAREGSVTHETADETAVTPPLKLVQKGLLEAFRRVYDGFSLDRIVADPELNEKLADTCAQIGLPGEPRTWNRALFRMRKAGLLTGLPTSRRTEFSWEDCEDYLFASEIAWRQMVNEGCESLDSILCDPFLAAKFDAMASRWAPGYKPLEYRWAAFKLRKRSQDARARAAVLSRTDCTEELPLSGPPVRRLPQESAVYAVTSATDNSYLYVGTASNLRQRVRNQFGGKIIDRWKEFSESLKARYFPTNCDATCRLAYQRLLVAAHQPRLNLL